MKAEDYEGDLSSFLGKYSYQPQLTKELDDIGDASFDQALVNEIILWKVNRYARIPDILLQDLDELRVLEPKEHRRA